MRLLVISLNYAPEVTGFAPQTTALAEHLSAQGHSITVLTGFPFAPQWRRHEAWQGRFMTREHQRGVNVIRVTHFIPRRPGSAPERLLMEGSFVLTGLLAIVPGFVRRQPFHVVLYTGAQPALAWLARAVARAHRAPYIVKITDLAAQAAVDVGIVRRGCAATLLQRIEFSAYRRAAGAIVLCDAFRDALTRRGHAAQDVHVIRDSVDPATMSPIADRRPFRQTLGIGDHDFLVLYAGSLGRKQGLIEAVHAAALLREDCPDVRWVLIGEGEMREALHQAIGDLRITDRVRLLPLQPDSEMRGLFAAADLLLLSQRRTVKDTVIPSKLLTYMAAGRPILAAVNTGSQAARLLRDADAGLVVQPDDPRAIAEGIRHLRQHPHELDGFARRGRDYAERHFDRAHILRAQQQLIEAIAHRGARAGSSRALAQCR